MKENKMINILNYLEETIDKKKHNNVNNSYTKNLLEGDLNKVIQKVGEIIC